MERVFTMDLIEYCFTIERRLLRKFQQVIELRGDVEHEVTRALIVRYISESLKQEDEELLKTSGETPLVQQLLALDTKKSEDYKALRRVAGWARRPDQSNHRILAAFFALEREGKVPKHELAALCAKSDTPFYVERFDGNFRSMCTEEGNSHGKVFNLCPNDDVKIWSAVEEYIRRYKGAFLIDKVSG